MSTVNNNSPLARGSQPTAGSHVTDDSVRVVPPDPNRAHGPQLPETTGLQKFQTRLTHVGTPGLKGSG